MIRLRRRAGAVLSLHAAAFAVLVACTGGHQAPPVPPIPATTIAPTTFPDFSSVSLAAIGGVTTLTISLTPGTAVINGRVLDDTGAAVPAAVVHIERLVGSQVAAADVAAGADGTYNAPGVIGGLYRVRAWRPPDLAVVDPQIFFLGSTETHTANLQMQRFTGVQVTSSIAPNPPIIGEPASLVVLVTASTVAGDGTVHGQAKPAVSVQLVGDGSWTVAGASSQTTGADGTASWQVTCGALGSQSLSVVIDATNSFPLDLPACAPVPTTTTSTTSTTSVVGRTSTSTTLKTH